MLILMVLFPDNLGVVSPALSLKVVNVTVPEPKVILLREAATQTQNKPLPVLARARGCQTRNQDPHHRLRHRLQGTGVRNLRLGGGARLQSCGQLYHFSIKFRTEN